jgi:hypothetical protein
VGLPEGGEDEQVRAEAHPQAGPLVLPPRPPAFLPVTEPRPRR